jgi:hypothetical protein
MVVEQLLNDTALHALPASMDQAQFPQTRGMGGIDVFIDDGRNVTRREGMQIEVSVDGQGYRVLILHVPYPIRAFRSGP